MTENLSKDAPQQATNPKKRSKALVWVLIIAAFAGAIGFAVLGFSTAQSQKAQEEIDQFRKIQFETAVKACDLRADTYQVMDNGESIQFDAVSKFYGASYDQAMCALKKIGAPESLSIKIAQTRALDGTMSSEWNEFEATWTYHPDSGLNLLVERVGEPMLPERS